MKQNEILLIGAGLLAVAIWNKGLKKSQLAENIKIRFKKIGFGMQGITPIITLTLTAQNPVNETQKITNVTATITTPEGNITSNLANPITIAANGTTDFAMQIKPDFDLIPVVTYLARNYKTKSFFVDLRIVTPLGTFTDKLPIKI